MCTADEPISQPGSPPVGLPIAEIVHELRTPLASIRGFAELLMDPALEPSLCSEHAATIHRNADRLLHLVEGLLDAVHLESSSVLTRPTPCDAELAASEVRRLLAPAARAKSIALQVECAPGLPAILTDPARLQQILINLVGNAIHFTDRGRILLRVHAADGLQGPGRLTLRFEVHDTGIGMTPEERNRLLAAAASASPAASGRAGGAGLGLMISHKLARALGGHIEVQSRPSLGSRFTLILPCEVAPALPPPAPSLPAAPPPAPSLPAAPPPALSGRILLAEDCPDTARLLAFHLRRAGAQVDLARNGRAAVEMALASRSQARDYDLLLMDVQMPILSGPEATRTLRHHAWRGPIILLSADVRGSSPNACISDGAGCDTCLTKPVDAAKLISACQDLMTAPRRAQAA